MAVCKGCRELGRELDKLQGQVAELQQENDNLHRQLEDEVEMAWDLIGDVRVSMMEIEEPYDYPVPLFDAMHVARKAV